VNCAAMPDGLLESELFGHTRGAFTDARAPKRGLFLEAHKGTLFLDEIGELPITLQPKILRAIEQRTVRPVGGNAESEFDARIVTATNRDLESAVAEKRFREDPLLSHQRRPHRATPASCARRRRAHARAALSRTLPSAQRKTDQGPLGRVRRAHHGVRVARERTRAPELHRARGRSRPVRRARRRRSSEKVLNYKPNHALVVSTNPTELAPLEEVERRYILHVLDSVSGNKSSAARILGLDRTTLYRRLERYGRGGDPDPD